MNQLAYNEAFRTISSTPAMRWLERAEPREGQRRDIRRIASTLFCTDGLDPSIVTFAKHRTALHWGLDEEAVDVLVSARLLQKTASLMADLEWLGTSFPEISEVPAAA